LRQHGDPAAVLNEVNNIVHGYSQRYNAEHQGLALFLSLFAAVLDARTGSVVYADAGHGYWCVRRAAGHIQSDHAGGGPPIGVVADQYYENQQLTLSPGDRLIVYSDGVVEQRSPNGDEFGSARVSEAVAGSNDAGEDVRAIIENVSRHADAIVGTGESPFADDVSVASVGFTR
jgi:sigma-B regulation protein RsbU (phosphoserine phosphatase)